MANILILGAGTMGTAFSFPCSDNKHSVKVLGTHLENDFIDKLNKTKIHPTLKCNLPNKVEFLKFENLSKEIKNSVDLIVIAVISKGIEWASFELSKLIKKNIPILILTKGLSINDNKYEILADKMERILKKNGVKETNISAAGGPCLAKDLAGRAHTSVIFANKNIEVVKQIKRLVSTDYYHIFLSDDVAGVEICAAIKNIFAMAVGSSKNLNTAAALVQQSINEMIIFTEKLNGKKETVISLAGIGDLYVSVDGGRNSKMGKFLGQGISFKEAKKNKMPHETVEGADLALEIGPQVKKDFDIKTLPLMISVIDTICSEKPLTINWNLFK